MEWIDYLIPLITKILPAMIVVTAIVAIVLFVKDGNESKEEGRTRKRGITVFFIVSMALLTVVVIQTVAIIVLGYLIMRSM